MIALASTQLLLGLALTLGASEVLVRGLKRLAHNLRLSAALLGLLAAIGADAPEISSALAAMHERAVDLGVGVIIGSNLFNLAALLGLSALLTGRLRFGHREVVLEGSLAVLILVLGAALLLGWLPGRAAGVLLLVALAVNVVALARRPAGQAAQPRNWVPVLLTAPALVALVLGSVLMVGATLKLGTAAHLPQVLLGTLGLAVITSVPNAYAAIRLAFEGRHRAVWTESLNSNNINLVIGAGLPAVLLGTPLSASPGMLGWLLALTVLTLGLALWLRGLGRVAGALIALVYVAFVAVSATGRIA